MINLEVVVSRGGQRVSGLGAQDFRLLVKGQEVPIEYFSEIASGRVIADPLSMSESSKRPRVPLALTPGEAVGTRYLVFIDDDFSLPSTRNRVLRELGQQVALLGPADRMAVVAFDGRDLDLLTTWTRSLSRLETVFEEAQERRAYGLLRRSERRRIATYQNLDRRGSRGASFSSTGFFGLGRARAGSDVPEVLHYADSGGQVERIVRAATSALRGFAKPPGRRVMLLLAGGWQSTWTDADNFRRLALEEQLFSPLIDTANRLGYTLYPIDLENKNATSFVGASESPRFVGRLRSPAVLDIAKRGEEALFHLARETGGRALMGGAGLTALRRVIDDTRSYYWLGFTPSWQGDDTEYRVDVKMRPKGLKPRSRRSFSDLSPQTEVSMMIESAHLFDAPLDGNIELAVEFGTPQLEGVGKVTVPLRLDIPFDEVITLPDAEGFAAHLELRIAATDSDGVSADLPVVPVVLRSSGAPVAGQLGVFETRLKLRRKPHRLLVAIFDPAAGKILSRRIEFEP